MTSRGMDLLNRAGRRSVALETTLLLHGVPRPDAMPLHRELCAIIRQEGSEPALVGVLAGRPIVGLSDTELTTLLESPNVPKANTSNLGSLLHLRSHAATTVSATMELAAAAGLCIFATGGLGGVHQGYAHQLDISSDLAALTRFPLAVVASGVKSILDVTATREALETMGIPVIGFQTDRFPAFYQRDGGARVDARFDDEASLARFIRFELARTNRGVLIANPIAAGDEIPKPQFERWLDQARQEAMAQGVGGREATPFILGRLHALSAGATLRANLALVKCNVRLAARLAAAIGPPTG